MIVENEILNAIKFFAVLQGEANEMLLEHCDYDCNEEVISNMQELANGGRWAMDYTALRHLQYILSYFYIDIENVLEFGFGTSSILFEDFINRRHRLNVVTYEHDKDWVSFNSRDWVEKWEGYEKYKGCVRISPLQEITYKGQKTLSYENNCTELLNEGKKFELIVIDAPFGQPNYSRPQILFLLPDIINKDNFIIFMDDTERQGEKQTISEICRILNENEIKYQIESYRGEKEHTIICDINKKYLLSSL